MRQKYLQLLTTSNAKANYSTTINSGINVKVCFILENNRSIQTPVIMLVVLVYLQLEFKNYEVRKREENKQSENLVRASTVYL